MNKDDKERLLARLAEEPLASHRHTLADYRVYLNEVTDCWTFGGLVLDVCGYGEWVCVPDDNKLPRYSKVGTWAYLRGEGEQRFGYLQLIAVKLGLEHLHGGVDTIFLTDWDIMRRYVEQL